jgi:type II secretory pathway component GspD/PulD (secretin)
MKNKFRLAIWVTVACVVSIGLGGGVWLFARPSDRVTLNVRNMEVRKLVALMERQTGRPIAVQSDVLGVVTLNAKSLPLEKALAIVGEQTFSRAGSIYPLYSSGKALANLKAILNGESPSANGWTNLQANGMRFGFGGPGPGPGRRGENFANATNQSVSLNISFEQLSFAALAFSRLTPARVVVEDGATNRVSVSLTNAPVAEAVATLAKKAGKKWTRLYVLSRGGPGRGPGAGAATEVASEASEERAAERETLNAELLATLPAEEREKREQAELDRQKRMEEFRNMTEAERAQLRTQMQPRGGSQRMLERLKESTPEQRAMQRQQMAQNRAARAAGSGGAFPPVTRN